MKYSNKDEPNQIVLGMVIGAGFGVALGLVMMQVFNHNGFFALGIGIGVSIGTAIGAALAQERDENDDD